MQLTLYTDYAVRVLLYIASKQDGPASVLEIANAFGISSNHLHKVVNQLSRRGYIKTTRGKKGGIVLGKSPDSIVLGELIRQTEPDFRIVECLEKSFSHCPIDSVCTLKHILISARESFLKTLDQYTLEDITGNIALLRPILIGEIRPREKRTSPHVSTPSSITSSRQ